MENISVTKFLEGSSNGIIVDVRTPAEYEKGHIVGAFNMPLFNNEERASVGTIYKKQGRDQAIEKGLDFVGARLSTFIKEIKREIKRKGGDRSTPLFLYCWRGGMRSNSLAWLLSTAGFNVEVLKGGYKMYRRFFLSKLKVNNWDLTILGGPTGCGKTDVLKSLTENGEQIIDLEGIACHRGSAFGAYGFDRPQPTSEQFANDLFHELSKLDASRTIWCEGESMSIGRVFMPQELYDLIQQSKFVYFTIPRDERINHIVRDYGDCPQELLIQSFNNITKRLGFDNAKRAINMVESGDIRSAVDIALGYYDKGYTHSIDGRKGEIIARVDMNEDNPDKTAKELIKTVKVK